jgi:hypothetical protein
MWQSLLGELPEKMETAKKPTALLRSKRRRLLVGGIMLVFLIAVGFAYRDRDVGDPIVSCHFDDGVTLDFLKVEATTHISIGEPDREPSVIREILQEFGVMTDWSTVAGERDIGGVMTMYVHTRPDGVSHGSDFRFLKKPEDGNGLAILFRFRDAKGLPIGNDAIWNGLEWDQIDRNQNGVLTATPSNGKPALKFELEDSLGHWNQLLGPFVPDSSDGLGVALARVFPRRSPTLKIRVSKPDCEPREFEVPNPDWHQSVKTWEPEPLPANRKTKNYSVTLKRLRSDRWGRWQPNFELSEFSLPGLESTSFRYSYTLSDPTGNSQPVLCAPALPANIVAPKWAPWQSGAVLLRSETVQRVTFAIYPEVNYPFQRNDVTIVGKCTWPTDDTPIVQILPAATELGISSLSCRDARRSNKEASCEIHISGAYPAAKPPGEQIASKGHVVLFKDGDPLAFGSVAPASSQSGTDVATNMHQFQRNWAWIAPIRAGDGFSIGLAPPHSPTKVEFTFRLEDAIAAPPKRHR